VKSSIVFWAGGSVGSDPERAFEAADRSLAAPSGGAITTSTRAKYARSIGRADRTFEAETRAFAERLASGATLAYAAGKRMVRAYLDGGIRAADKVVDEVAPPLFDSEDMRAGVAGLLEHGPRGFREHIVFRGR
jgi:hypothetical protein